MVCNLIVDLIVIVGMLHHGILIMMHVLILIGVMVRVMVMVECVMELRVIIDAVMRVIVMVVVMLIRHVMSVHVRVALVTVMTVEWRVTADRGQDAVLIRSRRHLGHVKLIRYMRVMHIVRVRVVTITIVERRCRQRRQLVQCSRMCVRHRRVRVMAVRAVMVE